MEVGRMREFGESSSRVRDIGCSEKYNRGKEGRDFLF